MSRRRHDHRRAAEGDEAAMGRRIDRHREVRGERPGRDTVDCAARKIGDVDLMWEAGAQRAKRMEALHKPLFSIVSRIRRQ